MVNRSRDQSTPSPSRRIWFRIAPPDSAFHSHTLATNASRPRSCRDLPSSLASSRSTTFWVAMPAWSMPGSHSTSYPCIRRRRVSASIRVWSSAWPMCSEPVTFGGGSTMQNGSRPLPASASKYPALTHRSYSAPSTATGWNWVGRPVEGRCGSGVFVTLRW